MNEAQMIKKFFLYNYFKLKLTIHSGTQVRHVAIFS